HRVIGCAVGPSPGLVDRDDARMLEARGDQYLTQKANLVRRAARMKLLDRDIAAELAVERARHAAEAAAVVLAEDLVTPGAAKVIRKARRLERISACRRARDPRNLVGSLTSRRRIGPALGYGRTILVTRETHCMHDNGGCAFIATRRD